MHFPMWLSENCYPCVIFTHASQSLVQRYESTLGYGVSLIRVNLNNGPIPQTLLERYLCLDSLGDM